MNALWRVAYRIAKIVQGVIEDPQSDSLEVPPEVAVPKREPGETPESIRKKRRGFTQAEVEARQNTPERLARRAEWEAEHARRVAETVGHKR